MKNAVRIRSIVCRRRRLIAAGWFAFSLSVAPLLAAAKLETPQQVPPQPAPAAAENVTRGLASWYGEEFAGRTTANGEVFEPVLFTAAHRTYPFGTILDVKNPANDKIVRVRVNDRGPYVEDRLIDLSYAAAKEIGIVDSGSGEVEVTVVSLGRGENEPPAPYSVTIAQSKGIPPSVRGAQTVAESATQQPAAAPAAAAESQIAPAAQTSTTQPAAQLQQAETPAATVVTESTPGAAVNTPAAPAPVAANPAPVPVQPSEVKIASEPPPVDFPLPSDLAKAKPAPQPAPAAAPPAVVSNVQVVEEHQGIETRRQVAADGKSVENVAQSGEPVAAAPEPSSSSTERAAAGEAAPPVQPHAKRYLVQIGAFGVESNAKALAELLGGFGMACRIDHDKLYRVRMGPFDTRDEAVKLRGELESKGISAMVVSE